MGRKLNIAIEGEVIGFTVMRSEGVPMKPSRIISTTTYYSGGGRQSSNWHMCNGSMDSIYLQVTCETMDCPTLKAAPTDTYEIVA
jgi:hypothetical protein